MESLLRLSCSTLTIEQGYDDEYTLPPIIEELRGRTKIFQIFFRTRATVIDAIVSHIFNDDNATTPPPSRPPSITLDPITPDPKIAGTRYKYFFFTIIFQKKKTITLFLTFVSYIILLV